ncbi:ferrous iron transport protein B [Clostridium algidicarnis]|uniref:Ferrous iron transport protein B n=1 Tax=Clostridium algidicarnis DSM 15099 TaxID=1121295 RepID=A0A2S6FVI5_9CLOT|nr:ferrous iron transport protein B [Clostridium algidicarnis]PPK45939.1 ferrous iron transport protein B [Clostridium algidicarnis DSM 15099]
MITAALLGNPNVGKTTLFNALTGSNQYVGNWPGVTVEKKEGFAYKNLKIVDLPGIYAMDTYSNEEKVSKSFLENGNVDVIINIVDASNLNRNLYLTTQLKQFNKPIILILNMMDVAESKGKTIDIKSLSKALNVTVIPMIASKRKGIKSILETIEKKEYVMPSADNDYYFPSEKSTYKYIENVLSTCVSKASSKNNISTSDKIDKVILNPFLAYLIFIGIMFLIFKVTFNWIGQPLSDMLDNFVSNSFSPFIEGLLESSSPWFSSLIVEGIIAGVGSVIVFIPIILTLFFCISILEDSGYMARVAFIMDKLMRKMGLSGKAFIPFVIGFGCSVPAIMSARTLESEKDRKLTALLVPLMSCNARLPVYAVFASAFFPKNADILVLSLYLLGIVMAFLLGILFKNTIFKKDEEPFIIELPEYKLPEAKNLLRHTWDKGKGFAKKAGTIIFAMSVVIWVLSKFSFGGYTETISESLLASIGSVIAPLLRPLGFGNWEAAVSLLTGFVAKESVVSTMGVIYGDQLSAILPLHFTSIAAISFLVFVLLYTPCVAVIATLKKEYGHKMAIFSITYQLALAWIMSFIVFNIGNLIF